MTKNILKFIILITLLFGLPLLGIALSGHSLEQYTEIPPVIQHTLHAPFSWTAFIIYAVIIFIFILPVLIYSYKYLRQCRKQTAAAGKFPWWGKLAVLAMILFWVVAWGDFDVFGRLHKHTFFPLWLSLIVTFNALQFRKTGKCLITEQPVKFLLLFPASAVFWWYFEYINGFVQNWYYVGADYSRLKFFLLSTIAFSTVLPGVSSAASLLSSYTWIKDGFNGVFKINNPAPKFSAMIAFIIFCVGLAFTGLFPDYLFFMVWLGPLVILVCLKIFFNEKNIFSGTDAGNWGPAVAAVTAALICGVFWETWNFYSLPKWQYSVPFVHRFLIFEMPLLGFSGYLPFGLLCVSISRMIGVKHELS